MQSVNRLSYNTQKEQRVRENERKGTKSDRVRIKGNKRQKEQK